MIQKEKCSVPLCSRFDREGKDEGCDRSESVFSALAIKRRCITPRFSERGAADSPTVRTTCSEEYYFRKWR
jgi:hypothetical protein